MADLNKPIVPAPNGYIVDLQNPQRRGEAIITWVGIVGMVFATTLLMIRGYTKVVLVKKMASDDCRFGYHSCTGSANTMARVSSTRMGESLLELQTLEVAGTVSHDSS